MKTFTKMNVDVGISGLKSDGIRQGRNKARNDNYGAKYGNLLITSHCHIKLLDNVISIFLYFVLAVANHCCGNIHSSNTSSVVGLEQRCSNMAY